MRGRRSLKRTVLSRAPKRKFVIYSEGKNTEPAYFQAIRTELLGALIDIEVIDAAGVPMTIAERATTHAKAMSRRRRCRSSFEESDQIWAIFDRDEHPNVADAIARCEAAKVGVAFSNPCFELWLILHFKDFDRPDDRHQVQSELSRICKDYDSRGGKSTDCRKLMSEVETAELRAEKQINRRQAEGEPLIRPFTTVYKLTRQMRIAHKAYLADGKK